MSRQGTIRRYILIIEKISRGQYPSFETIRDYLFDHGFEVSDRTVQRDIEQIRVEFGLELDYNREKNGYLINFDKSINTDSFFRFLEIVNTAELLTESLNESKDTLKYISFESNGIFRGIGHLKPLLKAIKDRRLISFAHYNFHTQKTRTFTLKPYLLREYLNRWYIVGTSGAKNEFRTFGLDRIENVQILPDTFIPDKKLNPAELFENIIGIVYSFNEQQKVVLSFTPVQGNYIKTLPLHKSQKVLIDNEKECRIELDIIPNYELTQRILMHGDTVKVIEPSWLAEEIKGQLQNTLAKYK